MKYYWTAGRIATTPPSRRKDANGGDANDHDDVDDEPDDPTTRSRLPCDRPSDDDDDDDGGGGGEGGVGVVRHRHLRRRPSDDERRQPHQRQQQQHRRQARAVTSGYRWWRGYDRKREKLFIPLLLLVVAALLLWSFLSGGASLPDLGEEKPTRLRSLPAVRGAHFIKAKATSTISRPRQLTLKTKTTRPPTQKPTHRFDCAKALIPQQQHEKNDDVIVRSSDANETLAVISVCIPGDRFDGEYIDASFANKMLFCDRWGAECILSRERLHPETTPKQYSPKWEKLFYITKAMYTTNADWLLWLDCDAAFTNFDLDWRVHLDGYLDRSRVLVASRDASGINLGVFLVPNTPYSRFFVEMMAEERYEIERRALSHKDQNALKNLLAKSPQLGCSVDDSVPQDKINSVGFFPNRTLKSFLSVLELVAAWSVTSLFRVPLPPSISII